MGEPLDPKLPFLLALRAEEAAAALSISRRFLHTLTKRGEIKAVKVGRAPGRTWSGGSRSGRTRRRRGVPMPADPDIIATAEGYAARGWSVIPVGQNKRPAVQTWKNAQQFATSAPDARYWFTRLNSAKGVGIVLGRVSVATVRRLIWAGKLKASRVGRSVRISSRELERFLASGGAA